MEERIRNCPCRSHFSSCYNLSTVYPNTSHVLKAGTTPNKVKEWVILLWALLLLLLTALSLELGCHLGPLAAQGFTPTASPGDDLHSQPEAP